jgi:uncharacterized protein
MSNLPAISYPAYYPMKVMGRNTPDFLQEVNRVVCWFDREFDAFDIVQKLSSDKGYSSISLTVHAKSEDHVSRLRKALSQITDVKIVI